MGSGPESGEGARQETKRTLSSYLQICEVFSIEGELEHQTLILKKIVIGIIAQEI